VSCVAPSELDSLDWSPTFSQCVGLFLIVRIRDLAKGVDKVTTFKRPGLTALKKGKFS
jgi:hypothetical protein